MAKDDVGSGPAGDGPENLPESLLPYDRWIEQAYRQVMIKALNHAAADGLPGGHHFYVTFRTDDPGTVVPKRMLAQYPTEMTIVLQHKFWDLSVDEATRTLSVGLSFGGVGATLGVPFDAMTGFADPSVKWGLRFRPVMPEAVPDAPSGSIGLVRAPEPAIPSEPVPADDDAPADAEAPQVVSLDAFRRKPD